ncbi:MAG: DUF4291 domain-containing protein [Verrucomicrobiales bacterium]|nr:DUF4291 domain-containing protein [Verrucomicrobiales bacterium]
MKTKTNKLKIKNYSEQILVWPQSGRHIMAQFDENNITVYQAYRPEIGHYAAKNQNFGGAFSFSRMSWIKPNFLWMMYRSGWGTKQGQEVILAVTIPRSLFDEILQQAVHSSFTSTLYADQDEWKQAVSLSNVRLQWDPDHDPHGKNLDRKAIQLGLRGDILERYACSEVIQIEDISDFVAEQRENLNEQLNQLITPEEHIYTPSTQEAITRTGITPTN